VKGWLRNGALVAASVALTLVGLETWVWIGFVAQAERQLERRLAEGTRAPVDTGSGELAAGVVWSHLPGLVYEVQPNLRGTYDGISFASNRLGFRHDHETQLAKRADVYRLLGVGDDTMFGRGVNNGETYLDRLQAKLGAYSPGRVEVINAAVWGYNTAQSVATVRWRAAPLEPDIVVLGLSGDDRNRPVVRGGIGADGPHLWRAAQRFFAGKHRDLVRRQKSEPASFETLVGQFDDLAHLAREHGFRVLVFSECLPVAGVERPSHCQLATLEQWQRWHHRNFTHWGFATCPWRWDLVPTGDVLPTADGNRILADRLYDCLMANRQLRPPLWTSDTVEIGVDQPSVRLLGCGISDPSARQARCGAGAELVLRWLPAGERYRVAVRLTGAGRVQLGAEHGLRAVEAGNDGLAIYPEPLTVRPSGELRLDLTASERVAVRALVLTPQPSE
jgi:hypothetical protein